MGAQDSRSNIHNLNFLSLQPCEGFWLRCSERHMSLMTVAHDTLRIRVA